MPKVPASCCMTCGAGCCTHVARALDAKDARIAELTLERDEARREWIKATTDLDLYQCGTDYDAKRRTEAERRWPRSGETLFP
jgi:hypothetical protein